MAVVPSFTPRSPRRHAKPPRPWAGGTRTRESAGLGHEAGVGTGSLSLINLDPIEEPAVGGASDFEPMPDANEAPAAAAEAQVTSGPIPEPEAAQSAPAQGETIPPTDALADDASEPIMTSRELGLAGAAVAEAVKARKQALASGEVEKLRSPGELAATGDDRRWSIVVASMDELAKAEEEVARLREKGLDVHARPFKTDQREGYRIGIGRYAEKSMAEAALKAILAERPLLSAWLARY